MAKAKGQAMDLPAQHDDEDAWKLALAPTEGGRLLVHHDGTWGLVGDDGWEVDSDELRSHITIAVVRPMMPTIEVQAISVKDSEIR
ncbi:hypothetical protein ACFVUS_24355 [Nocardia sp. NPDC058058]|uniref:hypothetical protein n=1 Tax=Nocardia sp. NPDC058058 TaxID=3346317 RepID=UPI0036DF6E63